MYYSDTNLRNIYTCNNNEYKSNIIHNYEKDGPDGSTIDNNDNYYSCLWGGSRIDIFDNFILKKSIQLDFKYPTCCCFGGKDMDRLFVTSASQENQKGYFSIIKLDTQGIKEETIKI
jgi:sugar lactone lactonase YvrE